MRPHGSITGPLIIILLGVLFLIHAISPDFPLTDWFGLYWPYLLIIWGVVALLEVSFRTFRGSAIPTNGVSGGAWLIIILIAIAGFGSFELRDRDLWWQNTDWSRGFDSAFGEEHEFAINAVQRDIGAAPHIVLQNFRGDAKIIGTNGTELTVGGHKTIRATKEEIAERTNAETPVEVVQDGGKVLIRCNQNRANRRAAVITNLDISVPKGASIEVNGSSGDLDISSVAGDVNLRSGSAGVRLQDIGSNVTVDTRRSDLIRCSNVKGSVDVRGHGSDLELARIDGRVTINGDYTGTVSLQQLSNLVHIQNMRADLQIASIPGELRWDRGSLNLQNAVGPVKVSAHSTDVSLQAISNSLDVSVDRGDIDVKQERAPLANIVVHAGSGNIELALPLAANFALTATTDHGQVENDFGDGLKEQTSGQGARLEGSVGSGAGPSVDIVTGRGTITVRKSGNAGQTSAASVVN